MTGAERGILLLCCSLGDGLSPLTLAQYRALGKLVRQHRGPDEADRDLTREDLLAIGCSEAEAGRILSLLDRQTLLDRRLRQWKAQGIEVCTRLSPDYPVRLTEKLGDDAPPVLFLRGDRSILTQAGIALVGSRDLTPVGAEYALAVGHLAAETGHVLISGNARGADQTAQNACLAKGGTVLAFVADSLVKHPVRERVLYVSEDGPDLAFTSGRALRRNRLIHSAAPWTFAAQCSYGTGGTWDGSLRNLRRGWSQLLVPDDGSRAAEELCRLGAVTVNLEQLKKTFALN